MEKLSKELQFLNLPSTLWGIHIHPQYEFIGILLGDEKYGLKAKIFINGYVAHLPNVVLDITNLTHLSSLIYLLHDKNICRNFAGTERDSDCLKLIDELGNNKTYCSLCQAKNTFRELTKNEAESCNYEVIDELQVVSYSHDQLSMDFKSQSDSIETTCNEYIPQTEVLIEKKRCNPREVKLVESEKDNNLERHESEDKLALCNFCGKMFSNGYRIEEHILTHTQKKPFHCKFCNKSFSKHFNLRMHEHTHSGKRPYICSMCGKSYTTSSNLRTHILSSHSNDKKHVCDICKMTFVYPRYLKLHMRKHTGERPFTCSTCGKKFSKNIHLTIHIRTHTGEKPHCCDICGKGFTTTGGMGYHRRVHHKDSNS